MEKVITNEQSSASELSKWALFIVLAVAATTTAIAIPIAAIIIAGLLSIFTLFGIINIHPALLLLVWAFAIFIAAKRGDMQ